MIELHFVQVCVGVVELPDFVPEGEASITLALQSAQRFVTYYELVNFLEKTDGTVF